MGFMDKVKAAAGDAATKAKEAAGTAQDKVEQAQTRKKINDKKQELGHLTYEERTKGTSSGPQADAIVSEIQSLEASLEAAEAAAPGSAAAADVPTGPPETAAPPPATSASDPSPGDFKL
jgi:hypothetical protein